MLFPSKIPLPDNFHYVLYNVIYFLSSSLSVELLNPSFPAFLRLDLE